MASDNCSTKTRVTQDNALLDAASDCGLINVAKLEKTESGMLTSSFCVIVARKRSRSFTQVTCRNKL